MEAARNPLLEAAAVWCARFAEALEPLTGEPVKFEVLEFSAEPIAGDVLCCRQQFSSGAGADVWIAAERAIWRSVATKVLEAAGLEQAGEEEAESTYLELLSQAAAGFANTLTSRTDREVVCSDSSVAGLPEGQTWIPLRILRPFSAELSVSCGTGLVEFWKADQGAGSESDSGPQTPQADSYGPFDLLLDVELPLSVSFGRASLQIKDALKLTTGSVVELDRAVTEPVDVVVNNRVIARGEVVVVDGNYGVRIAHIMSRDERLRSLE
jgi:flagellar motor switch protein FliN/FliY